MFHQNNTSIPKFYIPLQKSEGARPIIIYDHIYLCKKSGGARPIIIYDHIYKKCTFAKNVVGSDAYVNLRPYPSTDSTVTPRLSYEKEMVVGISLSVYLILEDK